MKQDKALRIFNEVYDKNYNEVYSYILAKTGDIDRSPEILNDAFAAFYKAILSRKKDDIENKRAYLYSIVKNRLAAYYAERSNNAFSLDDTSEDENYDVLIEKALSEQLCSVEQEAEQNILIRDILTYISSFSLPQRQAFTLRFIFDLPMEEIARELGVSKACAGNYIYRTLAKVRTEFSSRFTDR